MNIDIICVGKIKEKFFTDAISEYKKRLSRFAKVNIIEVSDEKIPQNASDKTEEQIKLTEGEKILAKINPGYTVAMCIEGDKTSSEGIAKRISKITQTSSRITFIIGGSLGLSDDVKSKSDLKLSFGDITLPHQLMRVVLLEQVYRAFKINANEAYHK